MFCIKSNFYITLKLQEGFVLAYVIFVVLSIYIVLIIIIFRI